MSLCCKKSPEGTTPQACLFPLSPRMKPFGHAAKELPPRMLGGFEAAYVAPRKPSVWRAILRRLAGALVVGVVVLLLLIAGADMYVRMLAKGRIHTTVESVPAGMPALVLGTSPRMTGGEDNTYFRGRMEAAAALFKAGKASFIIVSGDNEKMSYNEPRAMRKALESRGVPGDKIVSDYAGFRTLDSVVRVKEVFRQNKVVFVSQGFHNERAICLARHHDIDAHAFNAGGDPGGLPGLRNWLRERLARVRMVLDLYVFDTGPKYLGPPEPVPAQEPAPAKP